jgi:CubicO group peptidase (beta-lactamase class C family)
VTSPPRSLDLLDPRLRPLCEAHLAASRVPGASVAVVAGDRAYHLAWGRKAITGDEPVTAATGFDIGSGSKAFVSATVASLVADGLLAWDDPVVRHVPEFQLHDPWITQQVTLRDLCANRLGLPRAGLMEFGLAPSFPNEYVFANLRHTLPVHPFRGRFTYVNAGHSAAAVAAGRVSGRGFLATLRERILEPLGMSGTSGGAAAKTELADQAAWHAHVDGAPVPIETLYSDLFQGAGGMVVSGTDALQWLRLHLQGGRVDGRDIVAPQALAETHRPQVVARPGEDILSLFCPDAPMAAYALGWAVSSLQGHPLVCHSGATFGANSMTMLLPREGIGIAVYLNSAAPAGTPLAYALAGVLLTLPPRDWNAWFEAAALRAAGPPPEPGTEQPFDPSPYVGAYQHPADGALQIEVRDGALVGHVPHGYRMSFKAVCVGEHRFRVEFDHAERRSAPPGALNFTVEGGRARRVAFRFGVTGREFERA